MRTLESVCPEISRSEQYLAPPMQDREYGLANKQSCSSETSNGKWIELYARAINVIFVHVFLYGLFGCRQQRRAGL